MRSVLISAAAVLAAILGTVGGSLTANAASVQPAAVAAVSSYNWLNGVSCTSAKDCVAVGAVFSSTVGSLPLAEQWNGTSWKTLAVKLPAGGTGGQLYGVSCESGKCVAVGQFTDKARQDFGLAETWNGASWSAAKTAEPHGATSVSLLAISCATASHCVATGSYWLGGEHEVPLAETGSGTSWSAATPPVPAGSTESVLNGVSCAAGRCVAVGQATNSPAGDKASALTDFWNGQSWTRVAAPAPGRAPTLVGVSCTSAARCVAIGNSPPTEEAGVTLVTFADTWNGATWTEAVIPKPAKSATLAGVGCASAAKCLAVGSGFSTAAPFGNDKAYAAALNGTHWSLTRTPPTPAADDSEFRAVACPSPTACIAVGLESLDTFEAPYGTAALWNGKTWRAINPPR